MRAHGRLLPERFPAMPAAVEEEEEEIAKCDERSIGTDRDDEAEESSSVPTTSTTMRHKREGGKETCVVVVVTAAASRSDAAAISQQHQRQLLPLPRRKGSGKKSRIERTTTRAMIEALCAVAFLVTTVSRGSRVQSFALAPLPSSRAKSSARRPSQTEVSLAARSSSSSSSRNSRPRQRGTTKQQREPHKNNNNNSSGGGGGDSDNYYNKYQPLSAESTSRETRWQRAVRIERRTQYALDGLQNRDNPRRRASSSEADGSLRRGGDGTSGKNGNGGGGGSSRPPAAPSSGKQTVIIRRRERGVLSSVPSSSSSSSASSSSTLSTTTTKVQPIAFPDIRDCNSALATFGDGGDLLRALRLYFKMRKASQIALSLLSSSPEESDDDDDDDAESEDDDSHRYGAAPLVPTPTLVTYSTLMSRAIALGKPKVALRLWKIMRDQTDFFSHAAYNSAVAGPPGSPTPVGGGGGVAITASELRNLIVPDVKSANILMNTYAKLGDIDAAEDLMRQMQTRPVLPQKRQERQQITPQSPPSSNSQHDLVFGGGIDVPYLKPNLVTYNTLLDACQKTGSLDRALHWKSILESEDLRTEITYRSGRTRSIRLRPDARTYTSLIATVARKSSSGVGGGGAGTSIGNSNSYGTHDPSLAFQLLEEMKDEHGIAPNPLTYSALIDVCGRCRRSDLALTALRLMLRDDQMRYETTTKRRRRSGDAQASAQQHQHPHQQKQQTVGAWTAAINACGKTGRIDTALRLFFVSMPRFGVKPNVVTCSCLLDSLLKQGKTAESLEVLRYMKTHSLRPTEHTYSSLMTHASRLAGLEQRSSSRAESYQRRTTAARSGREDLETIESSDREQQQQASSANRPWPSLLDSQDGTPPSAQSGRSSKSNNDDDDESRTNKIANDPKQQIKNSAKEDPPRAVDVYGELMSTLIATAGKTPKPASSSSSSGAPADIAINSNSSNELYQVTMVFREMRASGVVPDLGSYHTLLRSCANAGDVDRAQDILREIRDSGNDLEPNQRTWRAMLRTAGKAKRPDVVLQTWKSAIASVGGEDGDEEVSRSRSAASSPSPSAAEASSSTTTTSRRKNENAPRRRRLSKGRSGGSKKNLSLSTFRTLLTALLVCAWDLRESDAHASIELYKIVIKCHRALLRRRASSSSSSSSSAATDDPQPYMGMHLVDAEAATDNPQILALVLQAVVNLRSLLGDDDDARGDVGDLERIGASIAGARCFDGIGVGSTPPREEDDPSSSSSSSSSPHALSYFDKKALNTARSWRERSPC